MNKPNTYPEMNAKIVKLLRVSDGPICHYAAARIEELESEVKRLREALGAAAQAVGKLRGQTP